MADYELLVLGFHPEGDEESFSPLQKVEPELVDGELWNLCENCGDVDGRTPVYFLPTYDDPELETRQYQTGGECSFCENCINDWILSGYGWTDEGVRGDDAWLEKFGMAVWAFVRDTTELPAIVKSYGGC